MPSGFDSLNVELNTAAPLVAPMKMAIAPDGRIFVTTQAGKVRIVKNDVLLPAPFLSINGVETFGDDGLQAIALDPEFSTAGAPGAGRFFTIHHFMSGSHGRPRISVYRAQSGNPDLAQPTPLATLDLDSMIAAGGGRPGSHVGATLQVGKDGALYVAVGMQDASQAECQDYTRSASKIFRLDRTTLGPAAGNPFFSSTNAIRRRVWGRGLRNPFNMAVDRVTGEIFISDVGSNHVVSPNPLGAWEETNAVPNPGLGGFVNAAPYDFGWPVSEGTGPHLVHRYENGQANENSGGKDCAIVGGDFYRPAFVAFPPAFVGAHFYADFCSTYLSYLPDDQQTPTTGLSAIPTNVASPFVASTGVAVTDVETHPDGSIYVLGRSTPERQGDAVGFMHKVFASGPVPQVEVTDPADGARFTTDGAGTINVPITVTASDTNGGLALVEVLVNDVVVGSCAASPCAVVAPALARGTYAVKGRARNVLGNTKTSAPVRITVDGPTATISTPLASTSFVAGSAVAFSGQGTTAQGTPIEAASAYAWTVYLRHGSHRHLQGSFTGKTGTFTLGRDAETDPNIAIDFVLTVTDTLGVSHSALRTIQPLRPTITLATTPVDGLELKLDSSFKMSNFAFSSVAGINRIITAPLRALHPTNGRHYELLGWAHGGSYQQVIATPSANTTYTANYRDATGAGTGLYGQYFATTTFTNRKAEANEAIAFDWGTGAPKTGLPADGFTVRWTGRVQPYFTEDHTFYVAADGGVRLWVDTSLIIDSWTESAAERKSRTIRLTGGSRYTITLEYIDNSGSARVNLAWATSGVLKEVIPASQLFPATVVAPPAPPADVLFVVGSTTLSPPDQAVRDRLVNPLGLTVDLVSGLDVTAAMATQTGRKLVLISETVASADVNTKLRTATVPVVSYEAALFDDLGMTGGTFGSDAGTTAGNQTQVNVVNPASPLAGGLPAGVHTVVGGAGVPFAWGIPAATADVAARIVGPATPAALFRYDAGVAMVSLTAPHRRAGLFIQAAAPQSLTASGWALFDATINWARGSVQTPMNQPPAASAGPDRSAQAGDSITIAGSATDDGRPNPPGALSLSWQQIAGPGSSTIANGETAAPTVSLPAGVSGTYLYRLTATDGDLSASDDVAVMVGLPAVATPTIVPNGGTFSTLDAPPVVVLATATAGAELRFTTDGSEPTSGSAVYSGPFTVSANTTVRARAFKPDLDPSAAASATFTFLTPTVATPAFSPAGGSFTSAQVVTLATPTAEARIHYTTDGSSPTTSSPLYTAPIPVAATTILRALAVKPGWIPSAVGSATYTINSARRALLVVGSAILSPSDAALAGRLESRGFMVTVKVDAATVSSDAGGQHVVLISESCASANLGTKFLTATIPVLVLEPALQDDMKMTGATWASDAGTITGATQLNVLAPAGALAAGFSGTTTVVTAPSTFVWGAPGASAVVVARLIGSTTRAGIYTYEAGATMVGGVAAGKRAAFFSHGATAVSHSGAGWTLFDALLAWAVP